MFRIGAKNRENTFCGKALVRIRAKIEKTPFVARPFTIVLMLFSSPLGSWVSL